MRGKSPSVSSLRVIDRPEARCDFSLAKEKEAIMMWKETPPEAARTSPGEGPGFELGLPMRVLGRDVSGRNFDERTVLRTMSHISAAFDLRSPVARESDLKLVVSLPKKLSDAGELYLVIRGRVVSLASSAPGISCRRITLKLESRYVIKPSVEDGWT